MTVATHIDEVPARDLPAAEEVPEEVPEAAPEVPEAPAEPEPEFVPPEEQFQDGFPDPDDAFPPEDVMAEWAEEPDESLEPALIRILEDLPEFAGPARDYRLCKEDVVTVPKVMAEALINSGKAAAVDPSP